MALLSLNNYSLELTVTKTSSCQLRIRMALKTSGDGIYSRAALSNSRSTEVARWVPLPLPSFPGAALARLSPRDAATWSRLGSEGFSPVDQVATATAQLISIARQISIHWTPNFWSVGWPMHRPDQRPTARRTYPHIGRTSIQGTGAEYRASNREYG